MSDQHLQNDPDRAGGLVPDSVGEFVEENPGGAFDPRTYADGGGNGGDEHGDTATDPERTGPVARPPMDDQRMVGPGEENAKAG